MTNDNLKEEFTKYCKGLVKENGVWNFYSNLEKNENSELLLEKMGKFVDLLNINDSIYLNMDIQNEIYDLL